MIAKHEDLESYEQCFKLPLRDVHLTASLEVVERRLRCRYTASQRRALNWHLGDHERLAREFHQLSSYDLVVDTDHSTSAEVTAVIVEVLQGWIAARQSCRKLRHCGFFDGAALRPLAAVR